MTPIELQNVVIDALRASVPVSLSDAQETAVSALKASNAGKEAADFGKWFSVNGAVLVERINAGL